MQLLLSFLLSSLYYFSPFISLFSFLISIFLYSFSSMVGNQSVVHIIRWRLGPVCDAMIFKQIYVTRNHFYMLYFDFYQSVWFRQFPFTPVNIAVLNFQYIRRRREFPVHSGYYSIPYPLYTGFMLHKVT
jgi:hypothetical protein